MRGNKFSKIKKTPFFLRYFKWTKKLKQFSILAGRIETKKTNFTIKY